MNDRYLDKLKKILPEPVRQFAGLVSLTFIVILSFVILKCFFWSRRRVGGKNEKGRGKNRRS